MVTPKYRSLTSEELQELEKEFVDFLVVNGITADAWVKIKENDKPAAEDMISLFSDVVMEGVLRKIQFLEFRASKDVKTFHCQENKIVLVGMSAPEGSDVDFTQQAQINEALNVKGFKVYTLDKDYQPDRQMEIFKMLNAGCQISDGKLYKALSMNLV